MRSRILLWTALAALISLSLYGFHSSRLLDQTLWSPGGLARLCWFSGIYAFAAALLVIWRPRWILPVAIILAAAYTVVAAGILALAAPCLFFLSSLMLGRAIWRRFAPAPSAPLDDLLALLLGIAAWLTLVSVAALFPINYPAVYAVALLAPILLNFREAGACGKRLLRLPAFSSRSEAAALALLVFTLAVHWLVTLKPEASSDGLAMHLVVPARVAWLHYWPYDFKQFIWAVMPMGGDWAFTANYLLGGEYAARLFNFGALLVIAGLLLGTIRRWLRMPGAMLLTALFLTTPIVQLETGSMMVENLWCVMLLGAAISVARVVEDGGSHYLPVAAALAGFALSVKFGAFAYVVPLAAIAIWVYYQAGKPRRAAGLAVAFLVLSSAWPYLNAWVRTGNPVFPFLNNVFHSPWCERILYADGRFHDPLSLRTLYDITFNSPRFLESQRGAIGFQYFLLFPVALLAFRRTWPRAALVALGVSVAGFLLTFRAESYLRYVFPALALSTLVIAAGLASVESLDRRLFAVLRAVIVLLIPLNVYFLSAAGWLHRDFFLNAFDKSEFDRYLRDSAPTRKAVDYLNREGGNPRVAFLADNGIADLRGTPFTNSWHSRLFQKRLLDSPSAIDDLKLFNQLGITWFVVAAPGASIASEPPHTDQFLANFATIEYTAGNLAVARLNENARYVTNRELQTILLRTLPPAPPGTYDDACPRLDFRGPWFRDLQFIHAIGHTLTYCSVGSCEAEFHFSGTSLVWIFTKAPNRGRAGVALDGVPHIVDQYAPGIEWQARQTFDGLPPGNHTLLLRVLHDKDPASAGYYVDLDALIVK